MKRKVIPFPDKEVDLSDTYVRFLAEKLSERKKRIELQKQSPKKPKGN